MKHCRNEWPEIGQPIAAGPQDEDCQSQFADTLLKREIAVDCDESVELTRSLGKQGAVVNARLAEPRHRLNFVSV